jgi:cytochrome c oxidase subunit 2
MWNFPLFPKEASTTAYQVDHLYFALLGVACFFTLLIFVGLAFFAARYRKGSKASRAGAGKEHLKLELTWTIIPLIISSGIFTWAASIYFDMHRAPQNAMEIYVVGKQWMWKIQHPEGNGEINELHVPIGRPVKLVMTSQDVIHSFYIPAFRVKQDVLPGRYSTLWFQATEAGEYHLFCAEYCGTGHSHMIGRVVAMEPEEYSHWLSETQPPGSMANTGEQVFQHFACNTCHKEADLGRGPSLHGLYGSTVHLEGGGTVAADQDYIRESILDPSAKITAGYRNIMPTYKGQMSNEQVAQLVEYVKSLGKKPKTVVKGNTK